VDVAQLDHAIIVQFKLASHRARLRYVNMALRRRYTL